MLSFIVNKCSRGGKGEVVWEEVENCLKELKVDYQAYFTEREAHGTELAECITSGNEEKTLVVIGGDGTISEVINGIKDFNKVSLGVIPVGSGNDFARGMGIKGTPAEMLKGIIDCKEQDIIDLGKVIWDDGKKSRYFVVSSGIGIDAEVCKRIINSKLKKFLNKIHMGKLTYLLVTIQSLFTMATTDVTIRFDGEEKRKIRKLIFNAVMNFRAEGGGVPMAPKASPRDGLLSICCIHTIPKWITFFYLPFLVLGKHGFIKGIDIENHKECDIILKKPMPLHADGEYLGEADRVRFICKENKLKLVK